MKVFISVVSHGHGELIKRLGCIITLSKKYDVVVKINKEEAGLSEFFKVNNIRYIDDNYGLGFGHNNNLVFKFCKEELGMRNKDFFFVINPDIITDCSTIDYLVDLMTKDNTKIASVNLFKDRELNIPDNSIRCFPSLFQFVRSFLGLGNTAIIEKSSILTSLEVDWAAGSFLAFNVRHYADLKGFDEGYFMYCEDIDICYRSNKFGVPVTFYPQIRITHLAEHANRKIVSKHFVWHVKSVFRFLLGKYGLIRGKSLLN